MRHWLSRLMIVTIAALSACSDPEVLDKRTANRPPETTLVCSPPDSSSGIDYKVHSLLVRK